MQKKKMLLTKKKIGKEEKQKTEEINRKQLAK